MQKLRQALLAAAPFAVRLYSFFVLLLWVIVIASTLLGPKSRNLARVQIGWESVALFWLVMGIGMGVVWLILRRILSRTKISLIRQRLLVAVTASAFLILGCALGLGLVGALGNHSATIAVFPNLTVNGNAARLILDTGGTSALWEAGARRLGVKYAEAPADVYSDALSAPMVISAGGNTFTTAMMIHPFSSDGTDPARQKDGAIGWSEVRDNILVFDSNQHTIRAARELPAETDGWIKLKILPALELLIEIPLPDQKAGRLLVDTGFTGGVGLPPGEWTRWKAAHPQARVTHFDYDGAWIDSGEAEQSQADKIEWGPLALTGVEVDGFPVTDGNEIAVLGMEALARLDLVVDGKNGWAYLHPRAAAEQGGRAAWTVAGDVRINGDSLLASACFDRGLKKERNDDFDGALADFTKAIELNPNMFLYFLARGVARESKNDYTGALADFDRLVELNPTDADSFANRGECLQMQGHYPEALADYTQAIQMDPASAREPRLLRQFLLLQEGLAPPDASLSAAGIDDAWTKTLALFLGGEVDEAGLWVAARVGDSQPDCIRQTEAFYFVGIRHLLKGDRTGAADNFHQAIGAGDKGPFHRLAHAELTRLDTAPAAAP